MSEDLESRLRWFLQNLDWLLEDYQLEDKNIRVELYFDTLDVRHTILGLQTFYIAGSFDAQKAFQTQKGRPLRDRMLVLCLAFDGRLGAINMLPPHQGELLAGLRQNFDIHINLPPDQMARQFLEAVRRTGQIKGDSPTPHDADDSQRLREVRESVGSAIKFYKALLLTRGITWQERLIRMRKAGTLKMEPLEIKFDAIIVSDIFKKLYPVFERMRPDRAGNFADAVALTILAKKVEKANADPAKQAERANADGEVVPRFYVSSVQVGVRPLFLDVINEAKLTDAFVYTGLAGRKSQVIRRSDYFVFKSTFQRPAGQDADAQGGPTSADDVRALRDQVAELLNNKTPITPRQVDQIVFKGKSLTEVINDINTFSFFTNVWLSTSTTDEEIVLEDLRQAASELKSESLTQEVREGLEDAKAMLEKGSSEFLFIKGLWEQLEPATEKLRTQVRERITERIDYLRDFGLLRFSFPKDARQKIKDVLDDLLKGTDNSVPNLIAACYMAHLTQKEKYVNDLSAAAAVLWVTDKFQDLAHLLSTVKPRPHYSLSLIYAAAIFETQEHENRGIAIMRQLHDNYQKTRNKERKFNLAVGLAYLNYHLWQRRGHGPKWETGQGGEGLKTDNEDLIREAIDLAYEAHYELGGGDWDMQKKVYALNQYLFYLVMGGREEEISNMHEAAIELLRYKGQGAKEWWQDRFDDTLAWYYYRLACGVNEEAHWNKHITKAIQYAQEAADGARWARSTRAFLDRLEVIKERGFQKSGGQAGGQAPKLLGIAPRE
jgi:hypothetical protein